MNTIFSQDVEAIPLFDVGEPSAQATQPSGTPRLRFANRQQKCLRICALDELVPEDHPVRVVWSYVSGLNVTPLLNQIRAVTDSPGAAAADPRILLALWLYATLRGVGSARELDRRCDPQTGEVPFQWLCGEVSVNYHTLADFRTGHVDFLDSLLTNGIAGLLEQGLVDMERVAQDGIKVRASAGASSFRRRQTLAECLLQAEQQVQTLKAEVHQDPGAGKRRQRRARERAARERAERIRLALEQLPLIEAKKKGDKKDQARASTTDAEARVMKMADGGFRPAFNVQLATDTKTQLITGVTVDNAGTDQGQLAPMVQQHQERYEQTPAEMLADGGFAKKEDIEAVSPPHGTTTVYTPVQKSKDPERDAHTPRADDKPAVAQWRQRMATPAAQEIYKDRASTAECVNAIARNRGLQQFRVRGLIKVKAVILWFVLAHNLMRTVTLRAEREKTRHRSEAGR
jgi:transposase/IS5 family transposase